MSVLTRLACCRADVSVGAPQLSGEGYGSGRPRCVSTQTNKLDGQQSARRCEQRRRKSKRIKLGSFFFFRRAGCWVHTLSISNIFQSLGLYKGHLGPTRSSCMLFPFDKVFCSGPRCLPCRTCVAFIHLSFTSNGVSCWQRRPSEGEHGALRGDDGGGGGGAGAGLPAHRLIR